VVVTSGGGLVVSDEVRAALDGGHAVVALESTIFSRLGLPSPANADALARCTRAVRDGGAVPALTAVLDGVAHVGVDESQHERILPGDVRKAAARDLPVAVAQRWPVGATTVSASLTLAAATGIEVFATGGIGGVHRGVESTGDVSADLPAIASLPVVTVCAGAKAFLDLARTFEWLETQSVPVLGWRTDDLPAFYSRTSGLRVPHRVDTAGDVAAVVWARRALDQRGGVLVTAPIPETDEIPWAEISTVLDAALREVHDAGIAGAAVTPFVLERIGAATAGRSVPANLALAEHNAAVAAEIAVALAISRARTSR
jgi:pseudouridine-5'-phosphate glycosidase